MEDTPRGTSQCMQERDKKGVVARKRPHRTAAELYALPGSPKTIKHRRLVLVEPRKPPMNINVGGPSRVDESGGVIGERFGDLMDPRLPPPLFKCIQQSLQFRALEIYSAQPGLTSRECLSAAEDHRFDSACTPGSPVVSCSRYRSRMGRTRP